jgi:hypothetical protein
LRLTKRLSEAIHSHKAWEPTLEITTQRKKVVILDNILQYLIM